MGKAKEIWEDFAANDPYFAVSTFDKFRSSNIDDEAKAEFFETGRQHIEEIWDDFRREFKIDPKPARALDYGCGVGRLVLPLAEKCESVTGVDIADAMLDETRRNAAAGGLKNVTVQNADEFWEADEDRYDLVHSYIVLQHIEPATGYKIVEKIVARLETGGLGMLHLTFKDSAPTFRRLRSRIYRDVPGVHRVLNLIRGKSEGVMPMYEYDRERILKILDKNGCRETFLRETDHGFLGAMIFFRKGDQHDSHN